MSSFLDGFKVLGEKFFDNSINGSKCSFFFWKSDSRLNSHIMIARKYG
jgi:hypothetical protein